MFFLRWYLLSSKWFFLFKIPFLWCKPLIQKFCFRRSNIICLHCRRWVLERKLASSDVPMEEQINLIKDLERKETEFMRLKRHKICVDDFELLTIIGRGAFGEVRKFIQYTCNSLEVDHSQWLYDFHFFFFWKQF